MKVLVVGSGGREHALAWKLGQSRKVEEIFIAPGNPGTAQVGTNVDIRADDIEGLRKFAADNGVGLTVVGPELPLTLGIVDAFEAAGLRAFGPSRKAAELEGSKAFCKDVMVRHAVPTAAYAKFTDAAAAKEYVRANGAPLVVKADGLAAGKGVIICATADEALAAVDSIMTDRDFAEAGDTVVIEEFLTGEEASFLAITDGVAVVPLAPAQDHKPAYDDDKGPNTGGMGAYTPAPVLGAELREKVMKTVMEPMVRAMRDEGRPYKGILYAGLMIKDGKARVLEFNCRFGDPEAQPILMRLESDLADVLLAATEQRLGGVTLKWDERAAVCVVMASGGYPGSYEKGRVIRGLDEASRMKGVMVFHAGTAEKNGETVTAGGRVLGVTGLGATIEDAIGLAYEAVDKISWEGAFCRRDIGKKAIGRQL